MVGSQRRLARFIATGGFTLLLAGQGYAQSSPPRLRGVPTQPPASVPFAPVAGSVPAPAAGSVPAPAAGWVPAPGSGSVPGSQPQTAGPGAPVSMLLQPAQEARIVFTDNSLAIHAENSSLAAILHQFSTTSGMRITGLGNDERVFGSFGPGAPRDVLADLLNGTAYNLVLLGDLNNGAPRELILSPATHAGEAPAAAAAPAPTTDDSAPEPEADIPQPPPPPDVSPAPVTAPGQPGVKTPQQLFEQLQQMRQQQQQQQQQQVPQQQ
jgi:hypothetical protein